MPSVNRARAADAVTDERSASRLRRARDSGRPHRGRPLGEPWERTRSPLGARDGVRRAARADRGVRWAVRAVGAAPLADTWEWDGTEWTQACTGACVAASPAARFAHAMAYDAARAVSPVVFGGRGGLVGLVARRHRLPTQEWDGTAWRRACTAPSCAPPPARFRARDGVRSGAWDEVGPLRRHELPVSGDRCLRRPVERDVGVGRGDLDQGRGSHPRPGWTRRARHMMAFDPSLGARGETVLFGGVHLVALGDTWEWDGSVDGPKSVPLRARAPVHVRTERPRVRRRRAARSCSSDERKLPPTRGTGTGQHGRSSPRASLRAPATPSPPAYDDVRRRLRPLTAASAGAPTPRRYVGRISAYAGPCDRRQRIMRDGSICAAGVCCLSACGVCETCASSGTCAPVTNATDPSCDGRRCDATGRCVKSDGEACASRSECLSTFCVDGVCCHTSCTDVCNACLGSLTGADSGTCLPATKGSDPHDDCPDEGACSCGADGRCDGLSERASRLLPPADVVRLWGNEPQRALLRVTSK